MLFGCVIAVMVEFIQGESNCKRNSEGGESMGEGMKPVLPERELDMIRGKMLVNRATQEELHEFLHYVNVLESLVDEASDEDFYGTEGWRHRIGWD